MTKPNRPPNDNDPICQLPSCGKHFVPNTLARTQKYCDNECKGAAMVTQVWVECDHGCGSADWKRPGVLHDGKWTCITCANESRRTDELKRFDSYAHGVGVEMRPGLGPCTLWTSTLDKDHYGVFGLSGQRVQVRADRYAWNLVNPPLLPTEHLRHDCDNPPCIRLSHLRTGTRLDNVQDMVDRDRQARGERMALALLTEEVVRAARLRYAAGGVSQQQLADEAGVAQPVMGRALNRKTWRHVV